MDIRRTYSPKDGKAVSCTISEPVEETIEGQKGWYAGVTFEGIDDLPDTMHVGGEDPMQALELAFHMVQMVQLANGLQWPAQSKPAGTAPVCDG